MYLLIMYFGIFVFFLCILPFSFLFNTIIIGQFLFIYFLEIFVFLYCILKALIFVQYICNLTNVILEIINFSNFLYIFALLFLFSVKL